MRSAAEHRPVHLLRVQGRYAAVSPQPVRLDRQSEQVLTHTHRKNSFMLWLLSYVINQLLIFNMIQEIAY